MKLHKFDKFIKFGEIPVNEQLSIYKGSSDNKENHLKGYEKGVSVYEYDELNDSVIIPKAMTSKSSVDTFYVV